MCKFNKMQLKKWVTSLFFVASLTIFFPSVFSQTTVVIEVNNTPSQNDDYLCWSPIPARARAVGSRPGSVMIVLNSEFSLYGGRVEFSQDLDIPASHDVYSSTPELELTLPDNGSWVRFFVNGTNASLDGKDVTIVALDRSTEARLGDARVMVRVRKNANELQDLERDRFLGALAEFKGNNREIGRPDSYQKYVEAHADAFTLGIHNGDAGFPLFLAWHRAFLLSFERELQKIDPRVTIPYWRFDEDSDRIFIQSFMGHIFKTEPTGLFEVNFSTDNPLFGWRPSNRLFLTRSNNPMLRLQDEPEATLFFRLLEELFVDPSFEVYGGSEGANAQIERYYHDAAHAWTGGLLSSTRSPADPVFFLLHANVDRAWAKWQEQLDRFDPSDPRSYPTQGSYPGTSVPDRFPKGSYALDGMWPWSLDDGSDTPHDRGDDWPSTGFEFPASEGLGPASPPTPASMIDFMNTMGVGRPHGVCYDDGSFGGASD